MAFEDLLDHRCDIYHMVKGEKDMGFAIKQTGFSYPKVPDVEDVACHFNVNANAELTQTESANEFIYSGKLQLPADTDVRVNDKVVDKNTGLAYTAEMPHNIRDHTGNVCLCCYCSDNRRSRHLRMDPHDQGQEKGA